MYLYIYIYIYIYCVLLKKKQSEKNRHNPCTTLHNVRFAFRRKRTRLHKAFSRRKSLCSTLCAQGVRLSTNRASTQRPAQGQHIRCMQGFCQGVPKVFARVLLRISYGVAEVFARVLFDCCLARLWYHIQDGLRVGFVPYHACGPVPPSRMLLAKGAPNP